MKSNKATGPDGISPKLFKSASHALSPHLTSLLDGASTMKLGMEVYPPVSLFSGPGKLLEPEINTAIVNHVMSNNLTPNQWAYRKGHSTELLLIHLTEK